MTPSNPLPQGRTIGIELSAESRRILERLQEMPQHVQERVRAAMDRANQLALGQIIRRRFTGKGPFPPRMGRLGVRTGRLRGSLRASRAEIRGPEVRSAIGSNVEYLGPHEFGFSGEVSVKAHTRANPRVRGSYIGKDGRPHTALRRRNTGTHTVRAHTRKVNIPERAPLRRGIREQERVYIRELEAALAALDGDPGDGGALPPPPGVLA